MKARLLTSCVERNNYAALIAPMSVFFSTIHAKESSRKHEKWGWLRGFFKARKSDGWLRFSR